MFNNLFSPKNKKSTAQYFLAVEIHESLIKTAVWQVEAETPSILSLGSYELWDSEDSLINGVDASLTEAIKGLGSEPDRVVFGLPDSWLSQNKVHPTKQKLVKRLISELSLNPIGLVTITEAIVSHLKTQEGVPPTAILLEIYPSKVIVSLVNLGEIQAQEEVGRSDDLARDVEEGLTRFEAEKLPARFILTNGSDLENEEQQIISYPWTEKLPFIHLPKVQVLPIDFSIRAIALSGGAEAAKSLGIAINDLSTETDLNPPEVEAVQVNPAVQSVTLDPSSLGFSVEEDSQVEPSLLVESVEEEVSEVPEDTPSPRAPILRPAFPKFSLPKLTLPAISLPKKAFLFVPVALLVLALLSTSLFYFFFGKVRVVLSITPVRVTKTLDLAIGTSPAPDLPTIVATKKTLSAKTSQTGETTGEAIVGEKATGKVNLYNYTNQPISLKAGTKIVSGNLVFTLDSATTVASSSGILDDNGSIPPGAATATVTAAKIGADANLDKGTQFSIDTYPQSSLRARSESAFSGGTSRAVKAVSKADQEKLLDIATQKIKTEIEEQLKKEDPDSRSLAIGSIRLTTKNFNHSVGDEAATLTLDLAGDLDVLVYSKNEMLSLIEKEILAGADPGLELQRDQTQVGLSEPTSSAENTFIVKANVDAVLLPKIDETAISNQAKGKRATVMKSLLMNTPGYKSARVLISPDLPLFTAFLPLNTSHFSYSVSSF